MPLDSAPAEIARPKIVHPDCQKIADFLKCYGWQPGAYGNMAEGFCLLGAAIMLNLNETFVARQLGFSGPDAAVRWNDGEGRTKHPRP